MINHRKIGHSEGLEARKFRLFNPNAKRKYALKKSRQSGYEARKSKP